MHTGTHLDAPMHYLHDAGGIETLDLKTLMGPARVIAIENHECITAEELSTKNLEGATRFLIKTRNSDEGWWAKPYHPDYCHMTAEAGRLLYDHGMALLGVDYLGVDAPDPNAPVHMLLMPLGVVLLEGLNPGERARGRLRAHRPAGPPQRTRRRARPRGFENPLGLSRIRLSHPRRGTTHV